MTTLQDLSDSDLAKYRNILTQLNRRHLDTRKYGYDTKFAVHLIRLLCEIEQILVEGDLDMQRDREQLKSVRNGEWTYERVIQYAQDKEKELESIYLKSTLPKYPDKVRMKNMLINCIEMHYGSLHEVIQVEKTDSDLILDKIQELLNDR